MKNDSKIQNCVYHIAKMKWAKINKKIRITEKEEQ